MVDVDIPLRCAHCGNRDDSTYTLTMPLCSAGCGHVMKPAIPQEKKGRASMKSSEQIRALDSELRVRLNCITTPCNVPETVMAVIRDLALDIHQALADAAASGDTELGVINLTGDRR
jgi:hypothetical protein